jgi:hypothetical protein
MPVATSTMGWSKPRQPLRDWRGFQISGPSAFRPPRPGSAQFRPGPAPFPPRLNGQVRGVGSESAPQPRLLTRPRSGLSPSGGPPFAHARERLVWDDPLLRAGQGIRALRSPGPAPFEASAAPAITPGGLEGKSVRAHIAWPGIYLMLVRTTSARPNLGGLIDPVGTDRHHVAAAPANAATAPTARSCGP